MKLLTKTFTTDENGWAEFAFVHITDDMKKEILALRELFQMVKSKDKSICEIVLWDPRARFFSGCEEDFLGELGGDWEALYKELEEKRFIKLPDDIDFELMKFIEEERTSVDCMVVTEAGFFWRAQHRHVADHCETHELSYELLL